MSAAIIVSYMLSSVVLVAIACLVAACVGRQAYHFFKESKNYSVENPSGRVNMCRF